MCHLCVCRKRSSEHELRELLREKEEHVTGLMEEGKNQWYPCSVSWAGFIERTCFVSMTYLILCTHNKPSNTRMDTAF